MKPFGVFALLAIATILSGVHASVCPSSGCTYQVFATGGTCTASASSSVLATAMSFYKTEFIEAVKDSCSATTGDRVAEKWVSLANKIAFSYASACVGAQAKCTTYGTGTIGCASASATAKALAKSYMHLVTEAYAEAANSCDKAPCNPDVAVSVVADVLATTFLEFIAEANARVSTKICVGPGKSAYANAYANCYAQIIARAFISAFAKASIKGGCTAISTDLTADAVATVDQVVGVKTCCNCEGYSTQCVANTPEPGKPIQYTCKVIKSGPDPTILYKDDYSNCPFTAAAIKARCKTKINDLADVCTCPNCSSCDCSTC